jgi:hypothetical protein
VCLYHGSATVLSSGDRSRLKLDAALERPSRFKKFDDQLLSGAIAWTFECLLCPYASSGGSTAFDHEVLTGATSGLGRAIAFQLARDGADVTVHDAKQ